MKKIITVCLLMFFVFTISQSCDGNRASKAKSLVNFKISLDHWHNLKYTHGNSYTYTVSSYSAFGSGTNTKITVIDNVVTSRSYEAFTIYDETSGYYLGFDNRIILDSYIETLETLGSHNLGAPAITIDVLYNTCLNEYLSVDAASNHITFNVGENSIIKDCYYTPEGCQDDCNFGIQLSHFEWLHTKNQ